MSRTRVAVIGYGVIGKRVADAVLLQPDMELIGVADIVTDWRIRSVAGRFPLYASTAEARDAMGQAGLSVAGGMDDLLAQVDVVVDATPKHVAAGNLPRYRAAGVKVILQGGESHDATGHHRLAKHEEQIMTAEFGETYLDYEGRVPAFIPKRRNKRPVP